MTRTQRILVIDVGGTNVKAHAPGATEPIRIPSGPMMTARRMVTAVKRATAASKYNLVSIGYPGVVANGRPVSEPRNLGGGCRLRLPQGVWLPRQGHQRRRDAGAWELHGRSHVVSWPRHWTRFNGD